MTLAEWAAGAGRVARPGQDSVWLHHQSTEGSMRHCIQELWLAAILHC